ncbi:hypothetical protein CAEBREN_28115 [Caenorhabditis brenneri]|uniref:PWWP domain-containing protein n=1 Tax=Caenorhabditis brenneri TaxID=135651 RepID=G0PMV3_CAEBE|nr:hypothetical protein CAEBREN_28115 [Caenorhabditis brenneri]
MDSSEPSCSTHNFQPDDLIWAKMKGFPPWPAKVLERSEDTPARRIPVMFFGTLETSFMKPNDLSDYAAHRSVHEIPRKHKDFNKAVQEIRKAAGVETETDEIQFPTIEKKSPPSSPTTGRKRQSSGRFLDAIMAGPDKMRGTRSGSASTKTRSRASSNASATKLLRDMMRKERHRLNSESSHGSKRKLLSNALLGGGGAPSTSDAFHDYADSTDFNALFGDAILGNFELNDDTKSWKSKRSRGSSKVFDDFFGRSRNRSGSASGRRSRMISLSGFSGVSDMFDELFNNQGDLDSHADQLMLTLNNMPSDGSIDRPLSPEMLNLNPMLQPAVEFCDRCGYECRLINGSWKCNSSHCGTIKTQGGASMTAVRGILDDPLKLPKLEIKTESLSDASADRVGGPEILPAKRARKPKRNSDDDDSDDEEASKRAKALKKKKKVHVNTLITRIENCSKITRMLPVITSSGLLAVRIPNFKFFGYVIVLDRNISKFPLIVEIQWQRHVNTDKVVTAKSKKHRLSRLVDIDIVSIVMDKSDHKCVVVTDIDGVASTKNVGSGMDGFVRTKKYQKTLDVKRWLHSNHQLSNQQNQLNRKKVTKLFQILELPSSSVVVSEEEEEVVIDGYNMKRKVGRPSKNDIKIRLRMQKEIEEKQAAANAARASQMPPDAPSNSGSAPPQQRRKYTKRKKDGLTGTTGNKRDYSPFDEDVKNRPMSPLDDRSASYRPCAMEKRARWWTGEKRRVDASPERDFGTTPADSAAAFRMMAHAVRSAAVTRADEIGTVNGSLDLLMDSLLGSMGPLLANLTKLPAFQGDNQLAQQLWNASAVHIPTFQ